MSNLNSSVRSKCRKLFVAAIDFGTTYSGYAFSSTSDWSKVLTSNWTGGKVVTLKTPTALLLDADQTFKAFGYEAEDQYIDLARDEEHEDYYFFHRFKMILHSEKAISRKTKLKDASGKEMEAIKVFKISIKFLVGDLMKTLRNSYPDIKESDVEYVITVPAIWDDRSKQFMREAAREAGIERSSLTIALEPEAASIHCQYLPAKDLNLSRSKYLGELAVGSKYLVADLGGGTADITVHHKIDDGSLEEMREASGGPWGGKSVDDEFEKYIEEIIGEESMKELKKSSFDDYLELMRNFELKKRSAKPGKEGNTHLSVPLGLVQIVKRDKSRKSLEKAIEMSPHAGKVTFENWKLKWKNEDFLRFFESTIKKIKEHLRGILYDSDMVAVETILMVGGFAECEVVQKAVREGFKMKRVVVPDDAGISVLKGAVYFGHIPDAISRRTARYTYGIQSWPEFNPTKHPESKKVEVNGRARCKDVFFKYITKGQHLTAGYEKSQIFQALNPKEKKLECAIYISDSKDPKYVDDPGCHRLGVLVIPLPDLPDGASIELEESMIFGETELRLQAKDIFSGKSYEVQLDLLAEPSTDDE
ncbi:heat shock 70 kDa protein 12B-like isoform X2 [Saccostrea echinata]|uniref:heat shock 70 kDa protein 12B-like isoform X2 n=1 Tax=Saccostrea echinata TaxID=191078 RepID=UPI002A7F819A|nr:heat shock 70 kDa protein 12B-like isoform X2 [Saccostrea echinata]